MVLQRPTLTPHLVYVCDLKPEARRLGLELGAVKAFSLVELSAAVSAPDPFTVHVVVDFAVSAQSECFVRFSCLFVFASQPSLRTTPLCVRALFAFESSDEVESSIKAG